HRANLAHRGASTGDSRTMGRERFPRAGLVTPLPGGFGNPLDRHYRPLREELASLAPGRVLPFAPGDSRKRGPRLSRGVKASASAAVERREEEKRSRPPKLGLPNAGRRGCQ